MFSVTETELDGLSDSGLSSAVDLSLFALSFGILVTLIITISTVDVNPPKIFASYVAAAIVFAIFSVLFGVRSVIAWKSAKKKLTEIKSSP